MLETTCGITDASSNRCVHHAQVELAICTPQSVAPDDAICFKIYDEGTDRTLVAPHSAFSSPEPPAPVRPRESFELRLMVFYDRAAAVSIAAPISAEVGLRRSVSPPVT